MLTGSLQQKLSLNSLPSRRDHQPESLVSVPLDSLELSKEKPSDSSLRKTLQAMASLALIAAPQAASAASAADSVDTEHVAPSETGFADQFKEVGQNLKDVKKNIRKTVDPWGYLDDYQSKVGDYDLRIRPLDLDLKPRLHHFTPGLRFKGDLLETSLSKSEEVGGGWTKRQGFTAKLHGEASTYDDPQLNLQAGVFREYRGVVGNDYHVRMQADAGIQQKFLGDDNGFRAGVGLLQEVEGGHHEIFGHDVKLYAEGHQGAYYNFGKGQTELSYSFMAGPKKDFDVSLLGHKGTLTVTVGPEIKGSSTGSAFETGIKSKVRVRF